MLNSSLKKILQIVNQDHLTPPEIMELIGKLLYNIGASIAKKHNLSPTSDVNVLNKRYYSFPSLDTALMLQGLMLLEWKRDLEENPEKLFWKEKGEKT